ncbi:unnamed protein product, partial [Effrenium voratum]
NNEKVPTKSTVFEDIEGGILQSHAARLQWLQQNPKRLQSEVGAVQRSLLLRPGLKGQWSEAAGNKLAAWLRTAPQGFHQEPPLALCDKEDSDSNCEDSSDNTDSSSTTSEANTEGTKDAEDKTEGGHGDVSVEGNPESTENAKDGGTIGSEPRKKKLRMAIGNLEEASQVLRNSCPDHECMARLRAAQQQVQEVLQSL